MYEPVLSSPFSSADESSQLANVIEIPHGANVIGNSQPTDVDEESYSTDSDSEEEPDEESLSASNDRSSIDKFMFPYNTDHDRAEGITAAEVKLYNLDMRSIVERGRMIGAGIQRILNDSIGISQAAQDQLVALIKEAKALAEFELKSEVKICFVGDQGAGKSSIINCALNCTKLAPTGNCGSSITSVPTEYRRRRHGDTALLTMEVEHLTRDEMIQKVILSLEDYRRPFLPENKDVEDDSMKEASEVAFDVLKSIFSHQRRFNKGFLRNMEVDGEGKVQDELLSWLDEVEFPHGWEEDNRIWRMAASSPDDYQTIMQKLHNSGLWIFTTIIRVYRDASILKNGIVLVDVPGLRDTNSAKVRMTEDYVFKSQFLFIVVQIGRSITAETVRTSLTGSLSRNVSLGFDRVAKYLNVGVICTHSHDIDVCEAVDELFPKKGPKAKRSKKKSEVNRLSREIKDAQKNGNLSKMKDAEKSLKQLLIQERAERVKLGLKEAYADDIPGTFDVFCVDNKSYKTGATKGDKAIDSVRTSGIPELRLFFNRMSVQAQLSESRSLVSRLEEIVNSLLLWHDPSKRDISHDKFEAKLRENKNYIGNSINKHQDYWMKSLETELSDVLTDENLKLYFTEAKTLARLWASEYKASQYNAWILKDGNHGTKKRGAHNWNAELSTTLKSDLDGPMERLIRKANLTQHDLLNDVLKQFKELLAYAHKLSLPQELRDNVSLKISSAEREYTRRKTQLGKNLLEVQLHALEGVNGGFMQYEMLEIYSDARKERGNGKFKRQKSTIESKICFDIYKNISSRLKKAMIESTEEGFRGHHKDLGHAIDEINADLERCTIKQDIKVEPELEEYRLRIAKDLEPLKKQIHSLGMQLPLEKDGNAMGKGQGKRAATGVDMSSVKRQKKTQ